MFETLPSVQSLQSLAHGSYATAFATTTGQVHWSLKELVSQFHDYMYFSMESWEGRVNQNDWHLFGQLSPLQVYQNHFAKPPSMTP